MARAGSRGALVYSVRELVRQAARILSEVEEAGEPAFVTRDGRFVAVIRPLAAGQVESAVLPEIARRIAGRGRGQRACAVAARPAPVRGAAAGRPGAEPRPAAR
jgi:antitoxin (DNA-binding transcriptional repressor) of toxin-antitoxin stability system